MTSSNPMRLTTRRGPREGRTSSISSRLAARWLIGTLIPLAMIGGACGRSEQLTAMKNRLDDPPQLMPMSVRGIIALPRLRRAYTHKQLTEIAAWEGRGVTVEGFVARLRQMKDGDYHIQITEAPIGQCLDHDTPDQLIAELTPGIRARKPRYTWENLTRLCGTDIRVRLVGWLLFDSSKHPQNKARSTPWEVHPITRIEVCCWRELD